MKQSHINKGIANGNFIKHYPNDATPLTINTFLYKGSKYSWSSDIKHYVKVSY